MSYPNANFPRWLFASMSKWFAVKAAAASVAMFVEGDDRDTSKQNDFTEFRLDGPYYKQLDSDQWRVTCEISIVCTSVKDEKDAYKIHRLTGVAAAAFDTSIPIYRYGDGPDDDGSLIDCMTLRTEHSEAVLIQNFGQRQVDLPILQSSVQGHYKGIFTL